MTRRVRQLLSESPLAFAMPRTESAPASIAIGRHLDFKNVRATPAKAVAAAVEAAAEEATHGGTVTDEDVPAVDEDGDVGAGREQGETKGDADEEQEGHGEEQGGQKEEKEEEEETNRDDEHEQQQEEAKSKTAAWLLPPSTPKHGQVGAQVDPIEEMYQSTQDLAKIFASDSVNSAVKRVGSPIMIEESRMRRSKSELNWRAMRLAWSGVAIVALRLLRPAVHCAALLSDSTTLIPEPLPLPPPLYPTPTPIPHPKARSRSKAAPEDILVARK